MSIDNDVPTVWAKVLEEEPWVPFEDPHLPGGENAAQVKILAPNVFYAWFPPGYSAPAHSHPFNTTYHMVKGALRFGDEGWVGANSVRGVQAGHVYGPEEADPVHGCEFLLVSDGPIGIDWDESA
ncbi:hypothetical protein GCM10027271_53170 [Saccharopolyspora gloriosae]|uniref:Quercetin dioxygenase-like cupin family protein n=1 Tax=Saccharopolyspora gloriosae TaxID=455344 RepID=A0A840NF33_9PSEU|nr:hypothetical protein [Saccharopolyspora gloriosae]MBB5068695.1 quercetin dioxygenase-like cupin family protein [Saccharopolyspora gloriosae]